MKSVLESGKIKNKRFYDIKALQKKITYSLFLCIDKDPHLLFSEERYLKNKERLFMKYKAQASKILQNRQLATYATFGRENIFSYACIKFI